MTRVVPQLCFTLMAPYGSWGASLSSATTAWKATDLDPPKSALVGLLGAALGVARPELGQLAASLFVAVRTGLRPLRDPRPDYHTVGRARRPDGARRWTRFEELTKTPGGQGPAGALLSKREYWACGLWTVAVASRGGRASLAPLAAALVHPHRVLYAGRKSCTLGLPPDPEIVDAPGPVAALAAYGWPWQRRPGLAAAPALGPLIALREAAGNTDGLAFDPDFPGAPAPTGDVVQRAVRRRDRPHPLALAGGRIYQRFHERTEIRMAFPDATPVGEG